MEKQYKCVYEHDNFKIYNIEKSWLIIAQNPRDNFSIKNFYDVLVINPTEKILNEYPFCLQIDNDKKRKNIIEKYNIFNTKIYFSKCHGKNYVVFTKEKILFSMNVNEIDQLNIVSKFKIKYIFGNNGEIMSKNTLIDKFKYLNN